MKLQWILLTYGLANAALYSAILPLWEGFDEPFHFGYVQYLANRQGFPDPRTTVLSREVGSSILIAPASGAVKHNLPQVTTYSDFFSWPRLQRAAMRKRLREIPPVSRWQPSDFVNYEALQAPLAYALLALPERALAHVPPPGRVFVLRIIGASIGVILLNFGAKRLFSELGLRDPYSGAAIFCALSCQMTWATMAHVANDWLAVPLTVWSLVAIVKYWKAPRLRAAAAVASLISAGLLAKAYFVAMIPVALAVFLVRKRWKDLAVGSAILLMTAGPWYVRNAIRYGAITGMQESRAGIGATALIRAAITLSWPRVVTTSVRAALWTGNNSFTSFSSHTLMAIVTAWLIALVLWATGRHVCVEWVIVLYSAVFLGALIYITVVSHVYTGGAANGPSPWYSQVLLVPALGLAFLGCAQSSRLGRAVAAILVVLFGYVMIATYVVKLIPLYGGYLGRTSLTSLTNLYSTRLPDVADNLDLLCLAPARILFGLLSVVIALAIAQVIILIRLFPARRPDGAGTEDTEGSAR